ncbi:glucose-6-phosphate isomerase [Ketogulonicigenium vulgare]|uniref:Glucose-6-phosphate isomerase n=1 Tax=Ketogulonicigenium vulgare (strain WSH-001) TaxID=759362 RepID=F9Y6U4_KETVW|nr:glucose-6-phosphate isomerase [Ketogulonicigenium vulgare]AEM40961.1 Glucose-6-phosphate isomerase [Ketogulonicigenium vulgare WSH-001]ALJ81110.1 glucose-6-phosphate isomerase [Ketogulonicigenium vulgare]ANW33860.1 glucose-6-phosphate isomerase [Ketogulonicigenium vulgare]AOZ54685.1 Glucose-6-phosphate isomerase [Ketogulonicigenium vulgare]
MIDFNALKTRAAAAKPIVAQLEDSKRVPDFSIMQDGLLFDYSKTTIDRDSRDLLLGLLETAGVAAKRDAMFGGTAINETEGRAVLHTALRNLNAGPIVVDGEDIMPSILETLAAMEAFAADVRTGAYQGQGGTITDVINIGIGGSDLGPVMAVRALSPYHDGPRCHFVSNIDPGDVAEVLKNCDPIRTLVIVASKTFTTIETMTNARTVRDWMAKSVSDPAAQFAAISSDLDKTAEFGIAAERVFGFGNYVGGRYSVWGPIGLSVMLAVGAAHFRDFLAGGAAMDQHFRDAPWQENLPAMLALVGLWHSHACDYATRAVLPYDNRLGRLPAYFQQLEMESNGKGVSMDGAPLPFHSGAVVWGEPGTNGQHAFYQLIHQGTRVIPCEFMIAARAHEPDLQYQQELLIANCLAQSKALMEGRGMDVARKIAASKGFTGDECERQASHRVFQGNRPSVTLAYEMMTPFVLGQIIALYEHRVFVEGVVLGINSFDQWGVELGKELATGLEPVVTGRQSTDGQDASTTALVDFLRGKGA